MKGKSDILLCDLDAFYASVEQAAESGEEKENRLTSARDGLRKKYGQEALFSGSRLYIKDDEP